MSKLKATSMVVYCATTPSRKPKTKAICLQWNRRTKHSQTQSLRTSSSGQRIIRLTAGQRKKALGGRLIWEQGWKLAKSRSSLVSSFEAQQRGYTTYKNVLMSSSSRLKYLWSISHSICSLIIFFWGMNMFLRISTSSVWRAAFVILFLIFMIFTIASCKQNIKRN